VEHSPGGWVRADESDSLATSFHLPEPNGAVEFLALRQQCIGDDPIDLMVDWVDNEFLATERQQSSTKVPNRRESSYRVTKSLAKHLSLIGVHFTSFPSEVRCFGKESLGKSRFAE